MELVPPTSFFCGEVFGDRSIGRFCAFKIEMRAEQWRKLHTFHTIKTHSFNTYIRSWCTLCVGFSDKWCQWATCDTRSIFDAGLFLRWTGCTWCTWWWWCAFACGQPSRISWFCLCLLWVNHLTNKFVTRWIGEFSVFLHFVHDAQCSRSCHRLTAVE